MATKINSVLKLIPSTSRPLSSFAPLLAQEASTSAAPIPSTSTLSSNGSTSTTSPFPSSSPAPSPFDPIVHLPLLHFSNSSKPDPSLVELPSALFNVPSRPSLLHKLVVAHLASLRVGQAASKNRSQVNYSGKKLRPQKGTGGPRLGSRGSPMLRGGGHAFALTPKGPDGWKRKVNRKEEQLGLCVGLSDKWRSGNLAVVDRLGLGEISTRVLRQKLGSLGWTDALFILANKESKAEIEANEAESFVLSSGNLPDVAVVENAEALGIWEIVKSKKVVMELDAVDEVIARLDPENKRVLDFEFLNEGEELSEEDLAALEAELESLRDLEDNQYLQEQVSLEPEVETSPKDTRV
ncbi:ribosomal protein L4 [Meredithblackwellia eburnea MCA 4105]